MSAETIEASATATATVTRKEPASQPGPHPQELVRYYSGKTASILRKYGPGPRIHFHVGLLDAPPQPHGSPEHHSRSMTQAQEAIMHFAADAWDARRCFAGDLLDVGCGLGGGAIFWAQECQARVTAVTLAEQHLPLIRLFARQAGVSERVLPLLADACCVGGPRRFDAAVAFEASCYLPRDAWFRHLATLLRPGGVVCVEEPFAERGAAQAEFDRYWHTRIGSVNEYIHAAQSAGFTLEQNIDLTDRTAEFWRHSTAWAESALQSEDSAEERRRLRLSIEQHQSLYGAWQRHDIEIRLLKFRLLPIAAARPEELPWI